jgi:hypothetical protein
MSVLRLIRELEIFLSTPIVVHLCILRLMIKLAKQSMKESNDFN